jgi:hypothetical protein
MALASSGEGAFLRGWVVVGVVVAVVVGVVVAVVVAMAGEFTPACV